MSDFALSDNVRRPAPAAAQVPRNERLAQVSRAAPLVQRAPAADGKKKDDGKKVTAKGEIDRSGKLETTDTTKVEDGQVTEETVTKPENAFSFKATIGLPLLPGKKLGPSFTLLDDLKLTVKTGAKGAEPLPVGGHRLDDLDTQLAMQLIQYRINDLSKASLSASAGEKRTFGDSPATTRTAKASAGITGGLKGDFSFGSLKLDGSTTVDASVSEVMGAKPEEKSALSLKASGGFGYTSPSFRILGAKSEVSAKASADLGASTAGSSLTGRKDSSSVGGSGEVGLKTELPSGSQLTLKLTVNGEARRDVVDDKVFSTTRTHGVGIGAAISF